MGTTEVKRRAVAILGSTGSIGRSTLELLELHPEWFRVTALTAASRVDDLAQQVRRHRPRIPRFETRARGVVFICPFDKS